MTDQFLVLGYQTVLIVTLITLFAGFVKGAVGFALPMIMISGMGSLLPAELALAGLILPTFVSNVFQALRQGSAAALASARVHWRYIAILLVFLVSSAQLVTIMPQWLMLLLLGVPITLFAVTQLAGWQLRFASRHRRRAELGIGSFAGFVGGISGVWGPPTVAYLTAIDTPKVEHVRTQGVIYGIGSVFLLAAHVNSGVLTAETTTFSAALLIPALAGMAIGIAVQDRLDQALFRKATLVVLVIAGLNLIRRSLTG